MALKAALFGGKDEEYEALGAWTGKSRAELAEEERDHSGPRELWLAWDEDRVVGMLRPWVRPDGRHALYFGPCDPAAYPVLIDQVRGECYTFADGADSALLTQFAELGFEVERTEYLYEIPVTLIEAPIPPGLDILSAAGTDLQRLMALDCALREDIPGADGWQPDPEWFRAETYDSPHFNPQAYLVALDHEEYVGLVRIWDGPHPLPRLGMIGVLPAYRRRGLALALISRAFAALHARGSSLVIAEADATNTASNTLLTGLGGRVTGTELELRRR